MASSNFNLSQFIGAVREDSLARVNLLRSSGLPIKDLLEQNTEVKVFR